MLLIGQFDSPFVRRVGIALAWYGMPFDHRPLSVFRDAERIAEFNPLRKVPTLVLDNGVVLTESFVCLQVIDELCAAEHGPNWPRLLCASAGSERLAVLRLCGLAVGVMEKAVSLVYEERVRETRSEVWTRRCELQVRSALRQLEAERETSSTALLFGDHLTHADVALSCMMTFIGEALPTLVSDGELPRLLQHTRLVESWPEFTLARQPFAIHRD